jgi:hypothetical protein
LRIRVSPYNPPEEFRKLFNVETVLGRVGVLRCEYQIQIGML